jgi:two-component system, NarL family, nitrate/nitrite response regulator NarL
MNSNPPFVPGQGTSTTGTILVIDELLLVSSALAHTLRRKGFDAHSVRVTDLAGVREAARAYQPGLVLLDLDLGSGRDGQPIDGIDLIGPLRDQGWTVMVITRTVSLDRIAHAIAAGATSWIVKGATFAELVHAAVEIMAGRGHRRPADRVVPINRRRQPQSPGQEHVKRPGRISSRRRVISFGDVGA